MPWRMKWQSIPVLLPGESRGQSSLVGYSPRGCRVGHDWVTALFHHHCGHLHRSIWVAPRAPWHSLELPAHSNGDDLVAKSYLTLALWPHVTVAYEAPLSMGSPRQGHWSGLLFPPPGQQNSGRIPHRLSCNHFFLLWEPKHNTDLGGCREWAEGRGREGWPRLGVSDKRYPSWGIFSWSDSALINYDDK